jgi:YVTN family beta-propeller protein
MRTVRVGFDRSDGGAEGDVTAACSGSRVRGLARVLFVIALVAGMGMEVWAGRAAGIAGVGTAGAPLRKIAEFELPGPPGKRFDYLTIDEDDNYLLSAHLGAGLLHVMDLRTNAVVNTVRDVPGVEGVAYIHEGRKVYTANWGENKIGVVDLARMRVIKKLPTEEKPDGIAYAAPFHKAYVSNERAKAESIIDVRTDTIVKVLRFDSETGVPQYDPVARKVYVNLQERNALVVIDPATDTVVDRYGVDGCRGNHGMAIDAERRRAFLSCEGNDTLTVLELDTHGAIAHFPMAKGADVVMFDPGLRRVYVGCSSGVISVFHMDDPAHFRKLQDVPVEPKIHSLAVDRRTHRVYAPAEQEEGRPASKMFVFEPVTD